MSRPKLPITRDKWALQVQSVLNIPPESPRVLGNTSSTDIITELKGAVSQPDELNRIVILKQVQNDNALKSTWLYYARTKV